MDKSVLDILDYEALAVECYMTRVSNAHYMEFLRATVWPQLEPEQHSLYEKLLESDRSRYVSVENLEEVINGGYEQRYGRYKRRLERFVRLCIDELKERHPRVFDKVRLIVTNNTVGGTCPCMSSIVANHLKAPPSVEVLDLGYMGCSAALLGLELASRLLRRGEIALVLSAELTSVMTNLRGQAASLVANCVFGDGVGAFLVAKPGHGYKPLLRIQDFSGSLISTDEGLDAIRYETNSSYHEIRLNDSIPDVAGQGIKKALDPLVRKNLLSWRDKASYLLTRKIPMWQRHVDYFVLHAAGNKVLKSIQEYLCLTDEQVAHNFLSFNKYGNTSSASIYYSLRELDQVRSLRTGNRLLFIAYGSGFMTRSMVATVA